MSVVLAVFALTACTRNAEPPATRPISGALDLALFLREHGVKYDSVENLDVTQMTHAKIDEAFAIRGKNLMIDILRIEDERTYAEAIDARLIRTQYDETLDRADDHGASVYISRPYVVVVRTEPREGEIAALLREVLPEDLS